MTHVWAKLFIDNSNTRNLALFFYAALWLQRGWFMISGFGFSQSQTRFSA
jgi:hypothetical protein